MRAHLGWLAPLLLAWATACDEQVDDPTGGSGGGSTSSSSTTSSSASPSSSTGSAGGGDVGSPVSCATLQDLARGDAPLTDAVGRPCTPGACVLERECDLLDLDCVDGLWSVLTASSCASDEACVSCFTDDCDTDCDYLACVHVDPPPSEGAFRCGETNCVVGEDVCVDETALYYELCGSGRFCQAAPDGCTTCACLAASTANFYCLEGCTEVGPGETQARVTAGVDGCLNCAAPEAPCEIDEDCCQAYGAQACDPSLLVCVFM